jgi:outer membrane protein assembly factor BamB
MTITGDLPTGHNYSLPLVSGATIFFTVYVGDSYFYVLDTATGNRIVMLKFDDNRLSTLAAIGSTAFFGTEKGSVIAYDASAKALKWSFEQKDVSFSSGHPVIADGVVYICGVRNGVYALSAETGALLWQYKHDKYLSGIAVQGDNVVVLSESSLIAIDRKTGTEKWHSSVGRDFYGPQILDDQIFVRHTAGEVRAYALQDVALRWKAKRNGGTVSPFVLYKGIVIYGEELGNLVALDARTGAEKWRFKTKKPCRDPLIAGTTLYARCSDHFHYALDPETGALKWSVATKAPGSTPIIADGVMYSLSSDGLLQAFQ